jgi:hypothetical protein
MERPDHLPVLLIAELGPTRDYLREVALVLGSLQRAFLPKHPRDWQHGLEVTMRGLSTQPFMVAGEAVQASLDLVSNKVRLDGNKWPLKDYDGPELFQEVQVWLQSKGVDVELEEPKFTDGSRHFDAGQANAYAGALWWMEARFRDLKAGINEGVTSPILLYPHHFDLSLVWFPYDDERQLRLGFSTGDETIAEPYLYLTAYPEPAGFTAIELPKAAHWQSDGFSGAILPYAVLQADKQPTELLKTCARQTLLKARALFG